MGAEQRLHAISGIPVSTLRWLCKHKPELIGARKHEGVWHIERVRFQQYVSSSDREVPLAAPTPAGAADAVEAA